jgi:hypothetical protein
MVFFVSRDEQVFATGDAGEALDSRSLQENKARVNDLLVRKEEAEENNDHGTIIIVNEEIEWITAELKKSGALLHHVDRQASDREKFRKSVGNAIQRTLKDIFNHDSKLGAHLSHPRLRLGYSLIYDPQVEILWNF